MRRQFLFVAQGHRAGTPTMLVQARPSKEAGALVRFGLTASKKVGGAVARNRARRRLRALARLLLPDHGAPGVDYVLIASPATVTARWGALLDDGKAALIRLARAIERHGDRPPGRAQPPLPEGPHEPGQ